MNAPPKKILLATDMSARSDRALDRAIVLKNQYSCELLALHVIKPAEESHQPMRRHFWSHARPGRAETDRALRKLKEHLGDKADRIQTRIGEGTPFEAIMAVIDAEGCDLLVIAAECANLFFPFSPAKTIARLIRHCPVPLLIVTEKARGPYGTVLVASDSAHSARNAITAAVALFPAQKLTLLHTHAAPGSYASESPERYRDEMRQIAGSAHAAFLASMGLTDVQKERITVLLEWGDLSRILAGIVEDSSADLVVMGLKKRRFFLDMLINNAAKYLIADLPCDVLVVRERPVAKHT